MAGAAHCSLQAKRLLLDPKFEGYKLSLEPLACYQLELDAGEQRGGCGCRASLRPVARPARWSAGRAPALGASVPGGGAGPARRAGGLRACSLSGTMGIGETQRFVSTFILMTGGNVGIGALPQPQAASWCTPVSVVRLLPYSSVSLSLSL